MESPFEFDWNKCSICVGTCKYKGQAGYVSDLRTSSLDAYPHLTTNLVNCHHRWYDPYSGRWLSRDPAGLEGGENAYEFCSGNPLMRVDPSGLQSEVAWAYLAGTTPQTAAERWNADRDRRNKHRRFADMRHAEMDITGTMDVLFPDVSLKAYNHNLFLGLLGAGNVRAISTETWRRMFRETYGFEVPKDEFGNFFEAAHIRAMADGGLDSFENVTFLAKKLHRDLHQSAGDYARWAREYWDRKLGRFSNIRQGQSVDEGDVDVEGEEDNK